MKRISVLLATLLIFSIGTSHAQETVFPPEWLAGCWESRSENFVYEEQWMRPAAGMMSGMSRTIAKNRLSGFEFLRIENNPESGQLEYVALPSGQALTAFTLVSADVQRLVFENLEHDFPQRIIYALEGGELVARIEGEQGGKTRGVDFVMRRVECAR